MKTGKIEQKTIKQITKLIYLKARTAPKTKGIDNLRISILTAAQKTQLAKTMRKIGNEQNIHSFLRDAQNIEGAAMVIIFGIEANAADLKYCGLCQKKNCAQLTEEKGICVFNGIDLGIALGSAVSLASTLGVDNRIMYTAGIAALKMNLFNKKVKIALALPLSGTGKNIFFDRP
ncbi:MAG: DUF2148 domain-containing protein [Candidatus Omnitrophota bacterium]